jgi:glyoxylase-like metal-dependent hydrolase (beta-lactamase superfamily II)
VHGERLITLPAGNASEWTGPTGNNTYLLPRGRSVLIDAGVGQRDHIESIAEALEEEPLALLLITHHHVDHVAGVPALRDKWPDLDVRGGEVGEPLIDGEIFDAGGTRLRAIHTPGHAHDHFCFLDERSGDVFCGDLARSGGTVVIPASRGGNLREYLGSLERIRALAPARMLPAHGPVIEHPRRLIDDYVAHRRDREQQILAALAAGCRTPLEIVARVYGELSATLRPAAEETVQAHLQKLREDNHPEPPRSTPVVK